MYDLLWSADRGLHGPRLVPCSCARRWDSVSKISRRRPYAVESMSLPGLVRIHGGL